MTSEERQAVLEGYERFPCIACCRLKVVRSGSDCVCDWCRHRWEQVPEKVVAPPYERRQLLDHGYLELIDHWGSEERIVEAARMSTGKGFLGWDPGPCPTCDGKGSNNLLPCRSCSGKGTHRGDQHLLSYLWRHKHHTPFEMAGITVEVQGPIMVFREWHRHRVPFGYNELSARYTPMPDANYLPTLERLLVPTDGPNKQASRDEGSPPLSEMDARLFLELLDTRYREAEQTYRWALEHGVPKELARLCIPVGRYSRMRATGNLRGWLAFVALRAASQAQYEIRVYAEAIGEVLSGLFPRTWSLYLEGGRDESVFGSQIRSQGTTEGPAV